jgi:hypothetical protein
MTDYIVSEEELGNALHEMISNACQDMHKVARDFCSDKQPITKVAEGEVTGFAVSTDTKINNGVYFETEKYKTFLFMDNVKALDCQGKHIEIYIKESK